MLRPENRTLLTDELTPPRGFQLSHAVGTTFTLDLTAALSVPMAFTSSQVAEDPDTTSIIGALMGVSERIDIFAQAGTWSVTGRTDLVSLLERSLHPVVPASGLFHPKVWLLEFTDGTQLRHRVVCASRNLTFDRSWDGLISIDSVPTDSAGPSTAGAAAPLAALVDHMVSRSRPALPAARRRRLADFSENLRRAAWDPSPHKGLAFHVLGLPASALPDSAPPDLSGNRMLIVSPFVSPEGLRHLAEGTRDVDLISRAETLDALPHDVAPHRTRLNTWILDSAVDDDHVDGGVPDALGADGGSLPSGSALPSLTGLHAKIISCVHHHQAKLFLGSANATSAAWGRNVEVMVEVRDTRSVLGPDALRDSLGHLAVPYHRGEETDDDAVAEETGLHALERHLIRLAAVPLTIRVSGTGPHRVEVSRTGPTPEAPSPVEVRWHLLGRPELGGRGLPGDQDTPTVLEDVAAIDLTALLRITVFGDGETRSTVALADLHGDPPRRRHAVIARQLTDPSKLMELLLILLQPQGTAPAAATAAIPSSAGGGAWSMLSSPGLLETLLQALASDADGLAEAKRLLDHLAADPDVPELPETFLNLWEAAWQAHRLHAPRTEEKEEQT